MLSGLREKHDRGRARHPAALCVVGPRCTEDCPPYPSKSRWRKNFKDALDSRGTARFRSRRRTQRQRRVPISEHEICDAQTRDSLWPAGRGHNLFSFQTYTQKSGRAATSHGIRSKLKIASRFVLHACHTTLCANHRLILRGAQPKLVPNQCRVGLSWGGHPIYSIPIFC